MNTTSTSPPPQNDRARQMKLATYASVFVAGLLICVKIVAWILTGSVSILASLVDSLMDSIASVINLFAVRYSLVPADSEHRFGHGKVEPMAALIQAGFIGGSAVFLILHAIEKLRFPHPLRDLDFGIAVMVFATIATGLLVLYQQRVIKRTQSTAIRADALHYKMDLLSNVGIIIAMSLSYTGMIWADSVFAIGLALYIFYNAALLGHDAFQQLMDRELNAETQAHIQALTLAHPCVKGAHDLRTRQSGQMKFIQIHLELDDQLSLIDAHTISEQVEQSIYKEFQDTEIIIHLDPQSAVKISSAKNRALNNNNSNE